MATTIDASALFSGAPTSIKYGGVEVGATTSVPKFEIEVESGAPQFTNAGGPVKDTQINRRAIPSVTLRVNEITAAKIAWALPDAEEAGGTITWALGRVSSSAYKDLVLTQVGADGSTLTLTIMNALSAESQSMDFDDDPANPLGLDLKFTGFYNEATPTVVPFSIVIT